jgi:hypothetical protein
MKLEVEGGLRPNLILTQAINTVCLKTRGITE